MILAGVGLLLEAAHGRPIPSHDDEQVLGVEAARLVAVDEFDMREPLAVRADFVLAFDD